MPVRMPITTQSIARAEKERSEREDPEADRSGDMSALRRFVARLANLAFAEQPDQMVCLAPRIGCQ